MHRVKVGLSHRQALNNQGLIRNAMLAAGASRYDTSGLAVEHDCMYMLMHQF